MVEIEARYDGGKKCTLTHQEGATLETDAPKDIGGDASAFSPTDLVAAALASCVLTTVAMYGERHALNLDGMTAPCRQGDDCLAAPDWPPAADRASAGIRGRRCSAPYSAHCLRLPSPCQPAPGD